MYIALDMRDYDQSKTDHLAKNRISIAQCNDLSVFTRHVDDCAMRLTYCDFHCQLIFCHIWEFYTTEKTATELFPQRRCLLQQ